MHGTPFQTAAKTAHIKQHRHILTIPLLQCLPSTVPLMPAHPEQLSSKPAPEPVAVKYNATHVQVQALCTYNKLM